MHNLTNSDLQRLHESPFKNLVKKNFHASRGGGGGGGGEGLRS